MTNETISICDIVQRAFIEFKLVNENSRCNGILFKHNFDNDKTLFVLANDGRCFINGNEVPYIIWTNRLLRFIHYMYSYTFIYTDYIPKRNKK